MVAKNRVKRYPYIRPAIIAPILDPISVGTNHVFNIFSSTELFFLCDEKDLQPVGIITPNEVATDTCIMISLGKPKDDKIW